MFYKFCQEEQPRTTSYEAYSSTTVEDRLLRTTSCHMSNQVDSYLQPLVEGTAISRLAINSKAVAHDGMVSKIPVCRKP